MFRPMGFAAVFARHDEEREELIEKAYASRQTQISRIRRLLDGQENALKKAFLASMDDVKSAVSLRRLADLIEKGDIGTAVDELDEQVGKYFSRFTNARTNAFIKAGVEEAAELSQSIPRVFMEFNQVNSGAVNAMRTNELRLIREISDNQRLTIRQALLGSIGEGVNPRQAAKDVRGAIGLTERQESAVRNYRRSLREGNTSALQRALRDKRFDGTVRRAITGEGKLSKEQINDLTARYRKRYLAYRAETIARTESLRAVHEGANELWEQASDTGQIKKEEVRRFWVTAKDPRVRDAHRAVPRLNTKGRAVNEPFQTPLGPLMYPGDPAGVPENTIQCRCVVITRIVPVESQNKGDSTGDAIQDADSLETARTPSPTALGAGPGRFTHLDVIDEGLRAGFRTETDFTDFLADLGVSYNPQTLGKDIAARLAVLRRVEARTGQRILRPDKEYDRALLGVKPKPKPKPKPPSRAKKELDNLKAEWRGILAGKLEHDTEMLNSLWDEGFDFGDVADLRLMRAIMEREGDGPELTFIQNNKRNFAFNSGKRAIATIDDPSVGFTPDDAPSLRHEFFHYIDSMGNKGRKTGSYASTSAADELRRDHKSMLARSSVDEKAAAKEMYAHLGIKHKPSDIADDIFAPLDRVIDADDSLSSVRGYEAALTKFIKSKGLDFDLDDFMDVVGITDPYDRLSRSAELAMHFVRGDRLAAADSINELLEVAVRRTDLASAARREIYYLWDFNGSLTNERFGRGHGPAYYKKGAHLFSGKIGDISDRNLAEGFANFHEMSYSSGSAYRQQIARFLFPETSKKFDNILDEIGKGKHGYDNGNDYVAAASANGDLDAPDFESSTGLVGDSYKIVRTADEAQDEHNAFIKVMGDDIDSKSDAGLGIRNYTSSKRIVYMQQYLEAKAVGDDDLAKDAMRKYAAPVDSDDRTLLVPTWGEDGLERHIKAIDEIADRPTDAPVVLYRAESFDKNKMPEAIDKIWDELEYGALERNRYTSMSFNQHELQNRLGVSGKDDVNFIYEIEVPEGTRGLVGVRDGLTRYPEEMEVFATPRVVFEVVDYTENVKLPYNDLDADPVRATVVRLRATNAEQDYDNSNLPDFTPTYLKDDEYNIWGVDKDDLDYFLGVHGKYREFTSQWKRPSGTEEYDATWAYTSTKAYSKMQEYSAARANGDAKAMKKASNKYVGELPKKMKKRTAEMHYDALIRESRIATPDNVTLYRGSTIPEDVYNKIKKQLDTGLWTDRERFSSTSVNPFSAKEFMRITLGPTKSVFYEIEVPKGSKGFVGVHSESTKWKDEFEVIVAPETKFEVVGYKEDVRMFDFIKGTVVRLRAVPSDVDVPAPPAAHSAKTPPVGPSNKPSVISPSKPSSAVDFGNPETLPAPTKTAMKPNARAMIELGMRDPDQFVAYLVHYGVKHTEANARRDFKGLLRAYLKAQNA